MKVFESSSVRAGLLIVVFIGLMGGCATRQEVEDREQELSDVRQELDETKSRLEQKNELIQELESKIESLQDELETVSEQKDQKIDELQDEIKKLKEEKSQLQEERDRIEKLRKQNETLQDKLSEVKEAKTTIERDNLVVTVESNILFDLGKAKLKPESKDTLRKVADAFSEYENRPIAVEGHTDTLPIQTERYPSNWHLSAARAVGVIQYLVDNHDIAPRRFIAAGFGEHHPVAPNNTEENRSKNRRVEIVLYPPGISGKFQATQ